MPIWAIDLDGLEPVTIHYINGIMIGQKPKLTAPSQWYVYEHNVSSYFSLPSSFRVTDPVSYDQAALYNTQNDNWQFYSTVSLRNEYYGWVSSQDNVYGSQWFAAAELVTGTYGVGAAEWTPPYFPLSESARHFLLEGNKFLIERNIKNAKLLLNGELDFTFTDASGKEISLKGLKGKELDYALVRYEQTQIEHFIKQYKDNNPDADMDGIYTNLNVLFLLPGPVANIVYSEFIGNFEVFNFESYNDRLKLGFEAVDEFYE